MVNRNKAYNSKQTGLHRLRKVLLNLTNGRTIRASPFGKSGSFGFSANGAACFVKNPDNKAFKQTINFPAFGHNQRKDSSNKPWIFPPLDTTLPSDRLLFCSFPAFRHKQNLVLIDWLLTSVPCWRLSLGVSVLLLRIVINNDCNNLSSLPYSGFDRQLSFLTCANRSTQTVIIGGCGV